MNNARLTIKPTAALTVAAEDVRVLLEAGNGEAALLYLHILQNGGVLDTERAARELHRSDRDIETTALRLREMGLLWENAGRRNVPLPERHLPEYPAEDVVRRSREDARFRALVDEVQMALGHTLSSADLKKLFGIYDEFGLPPEVIVLLVQHCKETYAARYGNGKNPGFAFIENEARDWFDREIMTYEQAEQWLTKLAERRSAIGRLRTALGISDRKLSPTERKYFEDWLSRGFPVESIVIAADRTVTNTGGLKWKYMDSIIQSWDRMKLYTPEQIEAGDKKPERKPGRFTPVKDRDDSKALEQIDRLMEKM
ncbi:MAG: DnaD domain protein [Oscillospiraceae bacterium]